MTKRELKEIVESTGAKVKWIRLYNGVFKVRIDWTDYLKVRHLISDAVTFTF
jgi:hypothetical protein